MKNICLGTALILLPFLAEAKFEDRLENTLRLSLPRMACNLEPSTPKPGWRKIDGEWKEIQFIPAPGSIVASPSLRDPDYYFHWNRDSALVADTLIRYLPRLENGPTSMALRRFLADFVYFSRALQDSASPHGLGEVRHNVDGSVDDIFWSRPQNDGPALRALALMRLVEQQGTAFDPALIGLARELILRDVNYLAEAYGEKSFDLWEYSHGHHFYTRMVQLGALERALGLFPVEAKPSWATAIADLRSSLRGHWDHEKLFYHFSVGPVRNGEGQDVGEVGGGQDSSVVFSVNHSGRRVGELASLDPKLMRSAFALEEYFRENFPLNRSHQFGPAMGRHAGDGYYGGNAFFFLTAGYAEYYYSLAALAGADSASLVVDELNRSLLQNVTGEDLTIGTDLFAGPSSRAQLRRKFIAKGDAFMNTMIDILPAEGMMAEQFSKVDGSPASAADLTWSYSSFLSAALAREAVEPSGIHYSRIPFSCSAPTR